MTLNDLDASTLENTPFDDILMPRHAHGSWLRHGCHPVSGIRVKTGKLGGRSASFGKKKESGARTAPYIHAYTSAYIASLRRTYSPRYGAPPDALTHFLVDHFLLACFALVRPARNG